MNKKIERLIYIIFIVEAIIYIIIKASKNTSITSDDILLILVINFITLMLYAVILYIKYNDDGYVSYRIVKPFVAMFIISVFLGISFIFIPYFKYIPYILKYIFKYIPTWLKAVIYLQIAVIVIPVLIFLVKYYKNKAEILKIERLYKDKIEKHEYYRDLLKDYSPAILSLVYNGKIKYADSLVATILDLKLNNYIDITKSGIKILNKDTKDVLINQKYILDKLKTYKKSFISFRDISSDFSTHKFKVNWMNNIINEAEKNGVCYTKTILSNIMEILLKILFFSIFSISAISIIFSNYETMFLFFMIIIIHMTALFSTAYFIKYNKIYSFTRSKLGIDLQHKMVGLKNYIKDYSQLSKNNLKSINIWEDYLIYAVIFDLKGALDINAKTLYKNLTEYEPTVKEYREIAIKRSVEKTERTLQLVEEKKENIFNQINFIFIISVICWILYFLTGIYAFFFGFKINGEMVYGINAFLHTLVVNLTIFSIIPILPISLLFIILYPTIKHKMKNRK